MTDYSVAIKIDRCERQLKRIADYLEIIAKAVDGFDPVWISAVLSGRD